MQYNVHYNCENFKINLKLQNNNCSFAATHNVFDHKGTATIARGRVSTSIFLKIFLLNGLAFSA